MDVTFKKLKTILYEKFSFHYDQIQLETNLELELGLDSREFFELLHEIEESFQIEISLDKVDKITQNHLIVTVEDIVDLIAE